MISCICKAMSGAMSGATFATLRQAVISQRWSYALGN